MLHAVCAVLGVLCVLYVLCPPAACAERAFMCCATPQRVLRAYGQALLQRLPKTANGQTNVLPPYVGTEW